MAGKPENLLPGGGSSDEARKNGRKGGRASGVSRRKKRYLRDILAKLLSAKCPGQDITTDEAITVALIEKALTGDVKAYETIRDTMGEKPVAQAQIEADTTLTISWKE